MAGANGGGAGAAHKQLHDLNAMSTQPLKEPDGAKAGGARCIPLSEPDLRGGRPSIYIVASPITGCLQEVPFVVEFEQRVAEIRRSAAWSRRRQRNRRAAPRAHCCRGATRRHVGDSGLDVHRHRQRSFGMLAPYRCWLISRMRTGRSTPASLARALKDKTRNVRAAVAVHTLGHPADIDALGGRSAMPPARSSSRMPPGRSARVYKGCPVGGFGDLAGFQLQRKQDRNRRWRGHGGYGYR